MRRQLSFLRGAFHEPEQIGAVVCFDASSGIGGKEWSIFPMLGFGMSISERKSRGIPMLDARMIDDFHSTRIVVVRQIHDKIGIVNPGGAFIHDHPGHGWVLHVTELSEDAEILIDRKSVV